MKIAIRLKVAVLFAVAGLHFLCSGAEAESEVANKPAIFWMPQGTYKNHFVAGSGFVPGKTAGVEFRKRPSYG